MYQTVTQFGFGKILDINLPKPYKGKSSIQVILAPEVLHKKLGRFYEVSSSDAPCLNGIRIDVDQVLSFRRLLSGLVSLKEAKQLAWKFYPECRRQDVVEFISTSCLVKELHKVQLRALPKDVLIEYIARDGYKITVEVIDTVYCVVEYERERHVNKCSSKEVALAMAASQMEFVSKLDNIKFTYRQY